MIRKRDRRRGGMQQMVGVLAVNDVDVMAAIRQRVRQSVDLHAIASKTIRRIEGGQMQKIQRPAHGSETVWITSIICLAACSQVSRAAAARPDSPIRRRRSEEE